MSESTLSSIILFLNQAVIISFALGLFALWKERDINFFSLLMFACALWSFGYGQELNATTIDVRILWAKIEYIGITTVPVFWFLYILKYTHHTEWVTKLRILALLIIPMLTLTAVWTNEYHSLIWSATSTANVGEITILSNSYGILFWFHTVYSYLLMLMGSLLLLTYIVYYPKHYHARILMMLLATSAPWISNVLYLTNTIAYIDTTPIAFTITGILMVWSILRINVLSAPVAYHVAMKGLSDGVVLIDTNHHITEVNDAMSRFLLKDPKALVGKTAQQIFSTELAFENVSTQQQVAIPLDESVSRHLKLEISPIIGVNKAISGHVIVAHDITAQKQAEDNMRYMLDHIETIKKEWEITADSLDQLICLVNEDGIVLRSNMAIENWGLESITRAKGQALSELVGRVYRDLGKQITNSWSEVLESLQNGHSYDVDVEDRHLGHHFELRFEPLPKQMNKHLNGTSIAVASIYDVTKRKHLEMDLQRAREEAEREHQKSEQLLLNILPQPIAHRLKNGDQIIADSVDNVTVLFADIVGFTKLASRITPTQLVEYLSEIFSEFDKLALKYDLEKIKTLGDAYMVVGGLPLPQDNHAQAIAHMALEMQDVIRQFSDKYDEQLSIRIGIHSGSVIAGVIGTKKFAYDLWGDTVNIASRMESHGIPDKIQLSDATYAHLSYDFEIEERGYIDIKNKGSMKTYFLNGELSPYAQKSHLEVNSLQNP